MLFALWCTLIGALLVFLALTATFFPRLPVSTAMLYLVIGVVLGPAALGLARLDVVTDGLLLERLTEIAVVVSLFTAGLKLRAPLRSGAWTPALRLATVGMALTVGAVAAVGVWGLGLPLGAAVLLGALLAPTDPVLANDVQVDHARDEDELRFTLTGEAGLNDGMAFPFVMLGLLLLGLHGTGEGLWAWVAVDVLWATVAGLGIGALLGTLAGQLVLYLRREHKEAVGTDDLLALGLIAGAYGLALLAHSYGFLAVFAAGLALRRVERRAGGKNADRALREVEQAAEIGENEEMATDRRTAPAFMVQAALAFNERLERVGEVAVVLVLGALLLVPPFELSVVWFAPLLFLVLRPAAVAVSLVGSPLTGVQRGLVAWFGVRGIGSVYYLAYAVTHGLPDGLARTLASLTLGTVAASIVVHGLSVTPLMAWYRRRHEEQPESEGSEGTVAPEPVA